MVLTPGRLLSLDVKCQKCFTNCTSFTEPPLCDGTADIDTEVGIIFSSPFSENLLLCLQKCKLAMEPCHGNQTGLCSVILQDFSTLTLIIKLHIILLNKNWCSISLGQLVFPFGEVTFHSGASQVVLYLKSKLDKTAAALGSKIKWELLVPFSKPWLTTMGKRLIRFVCNSL